MLVVVNNPVKTRLSRYKVEWHWARPRGMVGDTEGDKVQSECKNLVTGYLMSNVYVCACVCARACVSGWMAGWMMDDG